MITVLAADTHPAYRSVLVQILNLEDDIRVVGETSEVLPLQEMAAEMRPRIVLINSTLLHELGPGGIGHLKQAGGDPAVFVLSMFHDPKTIETALAAGADAFIPKVLGVTGVLDAIRSTSN